MPPRVSDYDDSYYKRFFTMAHIVFEAFLEAGLPAIVAVLFIAFIIATIAGLLGFDYSSPKESPDRTRTKQAVSENDLAQYLDEQTRLLLRWRF